MAIYSEDSFITSLTIIGLHIVVAFFDTCKQIFAAAGRFCFADANTKQMLVVIDLGFSYGDGYDYSYGCALSGMLIRS